MSAKCPTCGKTAYANESIVFNAATFHKGCFKCSSCSSTLDLKSAQKSGDSVMCKNCMEKKKKESGGKLGGAHAKAASPAAAAPAAAAADAAAATPAAEEAKKE